MRHTKDTVGSFQMGLAILGLAGVAIDVLYSGDTESGGLTQRVADEVLCIQQGGTLANERVSLKTPSYVEISAGSTPFTVPPGAGDGVEQVLRGIFPEKKESTCVARIVTGKE